MTLPTRSPAGSVQTASDAAWHALSPDEALAAQGVAIDGGLTSAEADARRAKYGKNTFAEAKKASRWQAFSSQYADPMQIVLLVAGIVCLFLPGQFYTGVFLILLTLFNAWMAMNQEGKAEASASALQGMMVVKVKVRRNGDLVEVPMEELVPGDIVNVEAGDLVPADARILTAATLEIDESALTGESVPTPKQVDAVAADAALGDRVDMAFMNCQVTRGAGTILVVTTGMATEVGHISGMLQATAVEKTPLTRAARRADEPDPRHRRHRARRVDRPRPVPGHPGPGAVPERRRVRGGGDPHGAPGRRHGHPVEGLADAGRRRRDHEAPSLRGDARLDLGAQLRQDGHPHAQPDDRGPDGRRRPAVRGHRQRLLDNRNHHPRGRSARRAARAVPPADGPLRRRRGPRRQPRGRPDRGGARRPRGEGRRRSDAHPGALPARRDPAVRRGLQDDGHVPRDDGRRRQGRHPRLHQGSARPAPRASGGRPRAGWARGADRGDPRGLPRGERTPRNPGPPGHGDRPEGLRPGHVRPGRGPAARDRRAHAARDRRDRRSATAGREGRHRAGEGGRDPGQDDHRRPCGHGRGDRPPARDRGPGGHRRRVPRDERRGGDAPDRRHRRHRPRLARGQGPPRGHPQEEGPRRRDDRRRRERRPGPEAEPTSASRWGSPGRRSASRPPS